MINETVENDDTEIGLCKYHCDYYDINEFQKITHTMTQKPQHISHQHLVITSKF